MEIHYDKHHRAYYTNFLNAIKGTTLEGKPLSDIFTTMSKQTDAVRNNGGGYYNHLFFWNNLSTKSSGPSADLSAAITKSFGSVDKFKETFNTAAKTRFGSGWAWLYLGADKNLAVASSPNQDNPLMDMSPVKGIPLLTLDVWEHAYYLIADFHFYMRGEFLPPWGECPKGEGVSLSIQKPLNLHCRCFLKRNRVRHNFLDLAEFIYLGIYIFL